MKSQPQFGDDAEHRIIPFRPRAPSAHVGKAAYPRPPLIAPDHLARFESSADDPDDFRSRMIINAAAMVFVAILTGIGIWLATSIADMRRNQDCVLMGRRDCAHISTPKG